MAFASLHNHVYASNIRFLDSINRPEELIDKAIRLGFSGVAFTDHESLSAAVSIIKIRDKVLKDHPDFKVIFGNEIYLIPDGEVGKGGKQYHFILLAKDEAGWDQLRRLSSRAWERGYTEKGIMRVPTTYKDIEEIVGPDKGHVFASTACLGGQLPTAIVAHDVHGANEFIRWCIGAFGEENFALELQPSDSEDQIRVNKTLIKMAAHYGLLYIITTDSHYLDKEDFPIHSAFLNSKQSSDRETDRFYRFTYMMEEAEMRSILAHGGLSDEEITAGIEATGKIADSVQNYDFRRPTIVPRIKIPEFELDRSLYHKGYASIDGFYDSPVDQDRYLMFQIERGIAEKKVILDEEKMRRIDTELDVLRCIGDHINENLSAYLNLTVNIVNIAWQVSLTGSGRGCFLPGSQVLLSDGKTKNIEDVKIGDCVITHTGESHKVYNVLNYDVDETMFSIKTLGGREIKCTNNHKILALKRGKCRNDSPKAPRCSIFCSRFDKCHHKKKEETRNPYWVEAQDLNNGDFVAIPKYSFQDDVKNKSLKISDYLDHFTVYNEEKGIINYKDQSNKYTGKNDVLLIKDNVPITPELCEIIGNWIGNGWTREGEVGCAFHSSAKQKIDSYCSKIQKIFGITPTLIPHKTKHCVQVMVYNKAIKIMAENLIGHRAENKHVPDFIFESKDRIISCLRGLADTDGSFDFKNERFKYSTVSPVLNSQVNWMFEALNICSNLKKDEKKTHPKWKTELINDISSLMFCKFIRIVFPEKADLLNERSTFASSRIKEDEKYYYVPIMNISTFPYKGKVHDLSVEKDTSYNINGVAVHNSACGFYINYLIGITQVDPLVYGLPYWRFLNKERAELPDVDEDFQPEKKEEIIQLLRKEYGEDNVLNCATFKTESLKSAILTCMRGLGYNNDEAQALAALVPNHRGKNYSLKDCLEGNEEEGFEPVPGFKEKLEAYPGLFEAVKKIEGLPSNASIHASALYVFNNGYIEHNSLMRAPNKTRMTAFNMHDSDDLGALKMDVLVTDAQSKMAKCLELLLKDHQIEWQGSLRKTYDKYLHPDVIDYDNPEMWKKAASGEIANLFQFETQVGSVCIKKARPTNVMQLAEINSIMRLQAEDGEQPIDKYVRFRNNIDAWYLEMMESGLNDGEIKILEKYLKKSFGISGSQETLMQILMDPMICNFTLGEANAARKAIAKKQAKKIVQLEKDFFTKGGETPNVDG